MVSIKWCFKQKDGLRIIAPNQNMADSYLRMAEDSINALKKVKENKIWAATTAYYVFYYSLYSLMLYAGVKCRIHSCSIKFMKRFLTEIYSKNDIKMLEKAFSARIDLQYYADREVDNNAIEEISRYCKEFYIKTKDIISGLTEAQINIIRKELRDELE